MANLCATTSAFTPKIYTYTRIIGAKVPLKVWSNGQKVGCFVCTTFLMVKK